MLRTRNDTVLEAFHPIVREWFESRFPAPTEVQVDCWKAVRTGKHVLVCAPTGSGKTLAAFLCFLDRLLRTPEEELPPGPLLVYVSPLRALSNDIARNLNEPLLEMGQIAETRGLRLPEVRVLVRTGDTSAYQRQRMLRRPPHILVTTPESLYLMLTARRSRELFSHVQAVIVDEIHALVQDRRGAHLSITLERLDRLARRPLQRIGLSATQRPLETVAAFLVGTKNVARSTGRPRCLVINHGHRRDLDVRVVVPDEPLSAVCSRETWESMLTRLVADITAHRSTLIFVATRRLAERLAHQLRQRVGEELVASHHGSLAADIRHDAERRLKAGQLRAIVATSSLELGIDVGHIDLVCNIGSPRSIASFLQRVGRAGHAVGRISRGHLYPLTWDDLLEAFALVRALADGDLETIHVPQAPLDILAQQLVAICAAEQSVDEDELFRLVQGAWPYRKLRREHFDRVVEMLTAHKHGMRRPLLRRDPVTRSLHARRGARMLALMNGGAIPELADYPVYTAEDHRFIGSVNEDFALESCIGDVFLLGNRTWEVQWVRKGEMIVRDAGNRPATVPFWLGEAPARSLELSRAVSSVREELANEFLRLDETSQDALIAPEATVPVTERMESLPGPLSATLEQLCDRFSACPWGIFQALRYVALEQRAVGAVPTLRRVVFERFFDDTGGMQIVIHSPWGARVNRAWGLALRKRFCRRFDFELQAAADDNGILLSVGPQHSFPLDLLFRLVTPANLMQSLEQAVLASPLFLVRWRWNANRSLLVPRMERGKRVPPNIQRFRADDLLAEVFPQQVACFEHRPPDLPIPDHPLVHQTLHDCLHEALDAAGALELLRSYERGEIEFLARETREPSPFSYALLNGRPYTFLDDAPLEERRSRAVITGRMPDLSGGDLMRLSPEAIDAVRQEIQATVRSGEDLVDLAALATMLPAELMPTAWQELAAELVVEKQLAEVRVGRVRAFVAPERLGIVLGAYGREHCRVRPEVLETESSMAGDQASAIQDIVGGILEILGVSTADELARLTGLPVRTVEVALKGLEGHGSVVQGKFDPRLAPRAIQWANRRLLWRMTRLTIRELRDRVAPVTRATVLGYLLGKHRITGEIRAHGPEGLLQVIQLLQGWHAPAGCWEPHLLACRCGDYEGEWLDRLHLEAAVVWGRLDGRNEGAGTLHRGTPITVCCRDDLEWLAPPDPPRAPNDRLSSAARMVFEYLCKHGALFERDLVRLTDLLPGQVHEALLELAAAGLATCDSFASIRPRVAPEYDSVRRRAHKRGRGRVKSVPQTPGRWSLLRGLPESVAPEKRAEHWARLLLERYGVVYREIQRQEPLAPPWRELARALRHLELRGEVRGGLFVDATSGEQFANPTTVEKLREVDPAGEIVVLSRCDPLCSPVLLEAPLPAARHTNFVVLVGPEPVAILEGDTVRTLRPLDEDILTRIERQLQRVVLHRASFNLQWVSAGASPPSSRWHASEHVG